VCVCSSVLFPASMQPDSEGLSVAQSKTYNINITAAPQLKPLHHKKNMLYLLHLMAFIGKKHNAVDTLPT